MRFNPAPRYSAASSKHHILCPPAGQPVRCGRITKHNDVKVKGVWSHLEGNAALWGFMVNLQRCCDCQSPDINTKSLDPHSACTAHCVDRHCYHGAAIVRTGNTVWQGCHEKGRH